MWTSRRLCPCPARVQDGRGHPCRGCSGCRCCRAEVPVGPGGSLGLSCHAFLFQYFLFEFHEPRDILFHRLIEISVSRMSLSFISSWYSPVLQHVDAGSDGQGEGTSTSQRHLPCGVTQGQSCGHRGTECWPCSEPALGSAASHLLCDRFSLQPVSEVGAVSCPLPCCPAVSGAIPCCCFPWSLILQVVEANDWCEAKGIAAEICACRKVQAGREQSSEVPLSEAQGLPQGDGGLSCRWLKPASTSSATDSPALSP